MIKTVVDRLQAEGVLFRRFEPFDLRHVGSRKRLRVFHGIDERQRYALVFFVRRKSRILQADVREWLELKERIEAYFGYAVWQNIAILQAPLCSRARALLEGEGWRLFSA